MPYVFQATDGNPDYEWIAFQSQEELERWISDILDCTSLSKLGHDVYFDIKVVEMTQEEIDALPMLEDA